VRARVRVNERKLFSGGRVDRKGIDGQDFAGVGRAHWRLAIRRARARGSSGRCKLLPDGSRIVSGSWVRTGRSTSPSPGEAEDFRRAVNPLPRWRISHHDGQCD
jgi:hypothetical protein